MSMTEGNFMNLLTIRNGNMSYVVQNERYTSSGDFVVIFFARESIFSIISPFLQLHRQRKMAARFFLHGANPTKVVLSGTPFLIISDRPHLNTELSDMGILGCSHV